VKRKKQFPTLRLSTARDQRVLPNTKGTVDEIGKPDERKREVLPQEKSPPRGRYEIVYTTRIGWPAIIVSRRADAGMEKPEFDVPRTNLEGKSLSMELRRLKASSKTPTKKSQQRRLSKDAKPGGPTLSEATGR